MKICDSNFLESFKEQVFNFVKHRQSSTSKLNKPLGIKLLTRLRVGLGQFKEHKFNRNFQDSIDCSWYCCNSIESTLYFFLHCANYTFQRQTLLNKIRSTKPNILAQKEISVIKTFLFGKADFRDSIN